MERKVRPVKSDLRHVQAFPAPLLQSGMDDGAFPVQNSSLALRPAITHLEKHKAMDVQGAKSHGKESTSMESW